MYWQAIQKSDSNITVTYLAIHHNNNKGTCILFSQLKVCNRSKQNIPRLRGNAETAWLFPLTVLREAEAKRYVFQKHRTKAASNSKTLDYKTRS